MIYDVFVTRDTTETAVVKTEAASANEAEEAVWAKLDDPVFFSSLVFAGDDFAEKPYVSDVQEA